MITINGNGLSSVIPIGYSGEDDARVVTFDVTDWVNTFGSGVVSAVHQRSADEYPYPIVLERDGNTVTWTVGSADVQYPGAGKLQLVYTVDGSVAKTMIFTTLTENSLGTTDPPDPYQTWLDTLTELSAEVQQYAEDAEDAKDDAVAAKEAAEDAQSDAETAQRAAEDAQEAAETAQEKAEEAQGKAEEAQGKAEEAQGKAETAQGAAETAALVSEGYAVGKQNGADVGATSPYYHNNAEYYKDQAGYAAQDASDAKDAALDAQDDAEDARDAILAMTAAASVDANTGTPEVEVEKTEEDGHAVLTFIFKNLKGATGNGIHSISLLSTSGLTKTYRITFTDGNYYDYSISDGSGVSSISVSKTGTSGLVDTYTGTITYSGGSTDTFTFTVTNGYSPSASVSKAGGTSTITITDENGTTSVSVLDGTDGTDGTDGITPTVSVTSITGGHNVSFDYGTGDARNVDFDVMDGINGEVTASSVASVYSSSATYAVGDYCWYSGQLYRCKVAISTAEAWTASHWEAVEIASDFGTLESIYYDTFEQGGIAATTGANASNTKRVRSKNWLPVSEFQFFYAPLGWQVEAFAYTTSKENGFLGKKTLIFKSSGDRYKYASNILGTYPTTKYVRFMIQANNEPVITPSDIQAAGLYAKFRISLKNTVDTLQPLQYLYETDLTLTETKRFSVLKGCDRTKNIIVTIDAMYEQAEGITDVPYLYVSRYRLGYDALLHRYYSVYNYLNGKGTYSRQMFRVPHFFKSSTDLELAIGVPAGVTVKVREVSVNYDNVINRDDCGIMLCAHGYCGFGGPANTIAAFEMAAKLGYRYCITIPKVTSDGVFVCLHDDDSIQATARNDDGTAIDEQYQNIPVSGFTYADLLQFDFGIYRGIDFAGERIPTLEEFFIICAKSGMHPMLSVHPSLTGYWDDIKALAVKYNLLDKLNIKSDQLNIEVPMAVLLDDVESYTIDDSGTDRVTRFNTLKSRYNITKARCVLEYHSDNITDSLISNALSNGYLCGMYSLTASFNYRSYFEKGVTVFTTDNNASVGLPW